MAYLETVAGQIVTALQGDGLTAFTEFELQTAPVPAVPAFVTVSAAEMQTGQPLPCPDGTAVPVTLRLRFRMHGLPGSDPDSLAILWELYILPELIGAGYALKSTELGELKYVKTLDRTVREGSAVVSALLLRTESS